MDFTAPFRARFKRAAAEGAEFELLLRMACEVVPELAHLAHTPAIAGAEEALTGHFAKRLSAEEVSLLKTARQLRNKILHADFQAAREKLKVAGVAPRAGGVWMVTVPSARERDSGEQPTVQRIADTTSTAQGTVFGWLVESGGSGDFDHAVDVFQRAASVVARLATESAEADEDPRADT